MAKLIRTILDLVQCNPSKNLYSSYEAMSQQCNDLVNQELQIQFQELYNNSTNFEEFCNQEFYNKLETYISSGNTNNFLSMLRLLDKLDNVMSDDFIHIFGFDDDWHTISALNSNISMTKIMLLPRCFCSWERSHRGSQNGIDLLNIMQYFYYIEVDDNMCIETEHGVKFKVKNYLLQEYLFSTCKQRKKLRVGVSPVIDKDILTVEHYVKDNENRFSVNIKSRDIVHIIGDRVCNILEEAKNKNVDIMVFPEMLGSIEIAERVKNKLSQYRDFSGKEYPSLIVLPSMWNERKNISFIYDRYGNEVARQEKHYPFYYEKHKSFEDILSNKEIVLFHCNGLGRVAIAICADAITNDFREILFTKLKVTFLIIPSYSTGHHDFDITFDMCNNYDTSGIWVNSCSALNPNKSSCVIIAHHTGKDALKRESLNEVVREKKYYNKECICEHGCLSTYEFLFQ